MERREIGEQKVGPRFLGIGLRGYFGICVKKAGIFRALRVLRGKIFVRFWFIRVRN